MAPIRGTLWDRVALRRIRAAADPDSPPRAVGLPAAWDGAAAEALAALVPGKGPASLPRAAEAWIARAARGADAAPGLAESLRALLLTRRGGPGTETWRGDPGAEARFVLNLPAFLEADGGFDADGYAEACAVGVRALDALAGGRARRLRLGFADLAGLLAGLGLPYDSPGARAVGAAVAALTRGAAGAESGRMAERLGALEPVALAWPAPPGETPVPGLAAAARAALDAAAGSPGLRHAAMLALSPPDAAEALLGVATGGIAPPEGAEAPVPDAARRAMRDAVAPFLHAPIPVPAAPPGEARPAPRHAPPPPPSRRHSGAVLHVSIGGHKVALRTAEDADGKLVEVAFTLSKEGAAYRSLMESFAQSVSLGLQRGVPLAEYVDAFAYTRFGPAGAVEGDPAIPRATSVLDWAFRRLALDHLGRRDLPQPSEEDCLPDSIGTAAQQAPLLPMDLPRLPAAASPRGRRRSLRLVG